MRPPQAERRRGVAGLSLMEAVVSLLLGLVLMGLVLTVLGRQRDVIASLGRRAEALATVRTLRVVLRREARALGAAAWEASTDSVALRGFRGSADVCPGVEGGNVIVVAPRGIRAADPAKDSVLALTGEGQVLFRALEDVAGEAPACSPGSASRWERWVLSDSVPAGLVLVRYFERGSYHISGAALRYRRGAAGRQPLTPEALRTPESRFLASGGALHALVFPIGGETSIDLFVGRRAP